MYLNAKSTNAMTVELTIRKMLVTLIKYAKSSFVPNLIFLKLYLSIILQGIMCTMCKNIQVKCASLPSYHFFLVAVALNK